MGTPDSKRVAKVHSGFLRAYDSVRKKILMLIDCALELSVSHAGCYRQRVLERGKAAH